MQHRVCSKSLLWVQEHLETEEASSTRTPFQALCLSWPLKGTIYELCPGHKLWVAGKGLPAGTVQADSTILQESGRHPSVRSMSKPRREL